MTNWLLLLCGLTSVAAFSAFYSFTSASTAAAVSPVTIEELKPDLVLLNGKIVTVDEDFSIAEAVAIKDGKFVAVGTNAQIQSLVGQHTEQVDLKGRTVLPGFIDPHVHFAHKVGKIDDPIEDMFSRSSSIEEVRKAVQLKIQEIPPGELVWFSRGPLRSSELQEDRWPTRYDLDPVSPDNPVIIGFAADHVTVVNSKLMEMVGITKDTPQPYERGFAGRIDKDPETGEPTGILREKGATTLARGPFNLYPTETLEENIKRGSQRVIPYGITTLFDPCTNIGKAMDNQPGLQAYQRLSAGGKLTVRINAMIRMPIRVQTLEENLAFLKGLLFAPGFRNDRLRIGTLKISVDGSGMRVPEKNVKAIFRAAHKAGWQMYIHLGGGESFDVVTDALEEAYREFPREDARHVITHARYPSRHNIEVLKKYGVMVEPQTGSLYRASDTVEDTLDPDRYGPIPTRTYLDNGIMVMTGTDQKPIGPLFTIWSSVNRLRKSGKALQPKERMTLEEAIRACTIVPAYSTFEENIKGSIEVGKLADLVILGRDILTVPKEDIRNIPVLMTMIGGRFVYVNPNEDPNQKVEYPFFG
ncbi:amidohydrolase family protein [Acidobacteria bacterium AH-259-D05]|nr:amidohydrolase family protein [Acidobacteria bacterium AH-259-D05]